MTFNLFKYDPQLIELPLRDLVIVFDMNVKYNVINLLDECSCDKEIRLICSNGPLPHKCNYPNGAILRMNLSHRCSYR
jgi:hypothetical protein